MKIKEGAKIHPSIAIAIATQIVQPILRKHGQELIITSMLDGKHMANSLHYKGLAVDLRIWDLHHKDSYIIKILVSVRCRLPSAVSSMSS